MMISRTATAAEPQQLGCTMTEQVFYVLTLHEAVNERFTGHHWIRNNRQMSQSQTIFFIKSYRYIAGTVFIFLFFFGNPSLFVLTRLWRLCGFMFFLQCDIVTPKKQFHVSLMGKYKDGETQTTQRRREREKKRRWIIRKLLVFVLGVLLDYFRGLNLCDWSGPPDHFWTFTDGQFFCLKI